MSKLTSPFTGDVKPAPSPTGCPAGHLEGVSGALAKPSDDSAVHTEFYADVEGLSGASSKAKLESPFEADFRPGVDSGKR